MSDAQAGPCFSNAEAMLKHSEAEAESEAKTTFRGTSTSHTLSAYVPNYEAFTSRTRELSEQIARSQIEQVTELSLIGYPTDFDPETRKVIETTLWLAAERVLEDEA